MKLASRTGIFVAVALAAGLLFAFDHIYGIPTALGYEHTSLVEVFSRRDFDGATWKNAANSNDPIRLKMVNALLRKHQLVGMSRSEIRRLLGPPDRADHYFGYDWAYLLGPERGWLSWDDEWLGIKYEKDTVVVAKDFRD